jgi:sugar fermentation stimulation protein A
VWFDPPLTEGVFLSRPNRFLAKVEIGGRDVLAHVHDPGRLEELLRPDARLLLRKAETEGRKTPYDVMLVRHGPAWVSVYTTLANRLVKDALLQRRLPEVGPYDRFDCEVADGASRIDFRLQGRDTAWLEVKSVTLVRGRTAFFPDAPTMRGCRHLNHLSDLARAGVRAMLLFVVQRPDADRVQAHRATDPMFADGLRRAAEAGVVLLARRCIVGPERIELSEPVEVMLD